MKNADPLVNRHFVIFGANSRWERQGEVEASLGDGNYLVRWFYLPREYPDTLAVVNVRDMGSAKLDREPGDWEFFDNEAHMIGWDKWHKEGCRRLMEVI